MPTSCCADTKECMCSPTKSDCIGRWMFAIPLMLFGIFHFLKGQEMTSILPGWPLALFFVYVSGAGLMFGALAIAINRYARLAAFLLALEIGAFILILHLPALLAGGDNVQMTFMSTLKDIALAGSALIIAAHMQNRGFSAK